MHYFKNFKQQISKNILNFIINLQYKAELIHFFEFIFY